MLRLFFSLFFVFLLGGCTNFHWQWGGTKPPTLRMDQPPPGPPEYQQGYMDGCSSGYSGYANDVTKLFHDWKQDPHLAANPVYYQIWKDAYSYCANYGMMADLHGWGNWR